MSVVIETECLSSGQMVQVEIWSDGSFEFLDYDLEPDEVEYEMGAEATPCYLFALSMQKPQFLTSILLEQEYSDKELKHVMAAAMRASCKVPPLEEFQGYKKALMDYIKDITGERFNSFHNAHAVAELDRQFLELEYMSRAGSEYSSVIWAHKRLRDVVEKFANMILRWDISNVVRVGMYGEIMKKTADAGGSIASEMLDARFAGKPLSMKRTQSSYEISRTGQNKVYSAAIKTLVKCLETEEG